MRLNPNVSMTAFVGNEKAFGGAIPKLNEKLTPRENFKILCSKIKNWIESEYDPSRLDISYYRHWLLFKLAKIGDQKAIERIKQEAMEKIHESIEIEREGKDWSEVAAKLNELISDAPEWDFLANISQEEVLDALLEPGEAATMKTIVAASHLPYAPTMYCIWNIIAHEEGTHRPGSLHYTLERGHVVELELALSREGVKSLSKLNLEILASLPHLRVLYCYKVDEPFLEPYFAKNDPYKFHDFQSRVYKNLSQQERLAWRIRKEAFERQLSNAGFKPTVDSDIGSMIIYSLIQQSSN
ncbi:MAG: hypothetical protein ACFE8P_02005 [Promethearchaeota archaeon]